MWGLLSITIAGGLYFASRGMIDLGGIHTAVTVVSVLVVLFVAIPVLKKLLAISRLLASVALIAKAWLIFTILGF